MNASSIAPFEVVVATWYGPPFPPGQGKVGRSETLASMCLWERGSAENVRIGGRGEEGIEDVPVGRVEIQVGGGLELAGDGAVGRVRLKMVSCDRLDHR